MSLLEVVIALQILGILFMCLFTFLKNQMRVDAQLDIMRRGSLEMFHFQNRIQDMFLSIDTSVERPFLSVKASKDSSGKLLFCFDQGPDPDPAFSASIFGALGIDSKQRLCLTVYPIEHREDEEKKRGEILLSRVDEWSFAFLDPVTMEWTSAWDATKKGIPLECRIVIHQGKKTTPFAFFFIPQKPLMVPTR